MTWVPGGVRDQWKAQAQSLHREAPRGAEAVMGKADEKDPGHEEPASLAQLCYLRSILRERTRKGKCD